MGERRTERRAGSAASTERRLRWPGRRLAAALVQWAGVAVVLFAHPRGRSVLLGLAVVLAARGVRNPHGVNRERVVVGARLAAISTGVLLAIGAATAMLAGPARTAGRPSLREVLVDALHRMAGGTTQWSDQATAAHAVSTMLPIASALLTLAVIAVVVGPQPDLPEPDAYERRRVERVCAGTGSDLMAPFTRRRDKRYAWSPDGRAVVGYRVVFGVSVAGPGPAGEPASHADALAAWLQRCDERSWRPAMIGADDAVRAATRAHGLHGLCIGDEVVVPVPPFRLDTPAMRNVRQAVQRTHNSGVTVTVHREGALPRVDREALAEVVAAWQGGHGERGFSMTLDHLLDGTHADALLLVAHHQGRPVGFQRYLTGSDGTGLSLDVMPRLRGAPNGVNERLIVEAVHWAAEQGIGEVSLNFAAFRTLFEADPTLPARTLRRVVHLLDRFLNVESLYRFNAKFHPRWNPRHVLFRSVVDLPFVLVAALRLEFGTRSATGTTAPALGTATEAG